MNAFPIRFLIFGNMTTCYNSTFFLLVYLLTVPALGQQVPNSGFENWTNMNGIWEPDDWNTQNGLSGDEPPVTRSMDAYEGDYAMKVEALLNPQIGPIAWYGEAFTQVAIDYIPPALNFYTKYIAASGSVLVDVKFYNDSLLVLYEGWYSTDTAEVYIPVSIPLEQVDSSVTHATIKVYALVGDAFPGIAQIWVDKMEFGEYSAVPELGKASLKVYPNPTNGMVYIKSAKDIGKLMIFNALGQMVWIEAVSGNEAEIDITSFKPGIYMLFSESGEKRRLIVE